MTFRSFLLASCGVLAFCGLTETSSTASTEKVIYNFPANSYPYGRPDQDSKGSLYGTGYDLDGSGAIYRLKQKNGVWSYKTLLDFGGSRGASPYSGPLIDRSTTTLYGTTLSGGSTNNGTVYSLAPAGRGWSETVLHNFTGSDGSQPYPVLLKDKATGNLYGTTYSGGAHGCGTFFRLAPTNGNWAFTSLYSFQGGSDACNPFTQLKAGAKAGTLIGASVSGNGTLFRLKETHGVWSEQVIYAFSGGSDGYSPDDLDRSSTDGSIYGVTELGGGFGNGVVFKLTPNLKTYTYSVIYNFRGGTDGAEGVGITFDSVSGGLYGTTLFGGTANRGTLFKLAPNGNAWTETVLHSFTGGTDGANPQSRPTIDRTTGALYGTTVFGGTSNGGTVYSVQP